MGHQPGIALLIAAFGCLSPRAQAAPTAEEPIPKARTKGKPTAPASPDAMSGKLPPYMGLLGPAPVVEGRALRGAVGSWVEFTGRSTGPMGDFWFIQRIQEVGPPVAGGHWIEFEQKMKAAESGKTPSELPGSVVTRVLVRGTGRGNVERFLASVPGMPPLDLQTRQMDLTRLPPLMQGLIPATASSGKKVASETIPSPAGELPCERWKLDDGSEYWITEDGRVPFVGTVQFRTTNSTLFRLSGVGTDALPLLPSVR